MKAFKIKIFSTKIKNGMGGISTALVGYIDGFDELQIRYEKVTTHSDTSKLSCYISALFSACRTREGEYCWFHVGPWLSIFRKLSLIIICKIKNAKIITHFHSPKTYAYAHNYWGRFLLKFLIRFSHRVIVLTPWWKSFFVEILNCDPTKIVVSPNPIDKKIYDIALKNIIPQGDKVIVTMSRLEEGKGVDKVILAMNYLLKDGYKLLIAGSGSKLDFYKKIVVDNGLSNCVSFLGWVGYKDKFELLANAQVFCLPSKLDSFGMVYIEAMSANLPVIALNYQAIPDVIPKNCGFLLDSDSPELIASAIMNACSKENHNYGAKHVIENYGYLNVSKRFIRNVIDR